MQHQGDVLVQQIALTCADGTCRVMSFVVDDHRGLINPPTETNINAVIDKLVEVWAIGLPHLVPITSWRLIEDYVPTDKQYHDARVDDGTAIGHDMEKAGAVHLDLLRAERETALAALDIEWMKALGQKDDLAAEAVEEKRQALRDMPVTLASDIAAATTIEELKEIKLPE